MFRSPVVRRRGSPVLRTAIVGGVAYAAGSSAAKGTAREASQEQRIAELEQQQRAAAPAAAPAPPAGMTADKMEQLKQLGELRQSGILTDAEFEIEKQKILRGY